MMKKIASILLGLISVVSFALTGCQSGMEFKAGTVDTVSNAVTEPAATPSEEREPLNNDEVTKPSVPQNENEIETNKLEQTVSELIINAEGVPVEVRLASDGQYSYEYNKDQYAVTTTTNGSAFEIKVTDIRPEIGSENQTNVIVYIPNQSYTLITGVLTGSSLILPAINVNINVTSNASSVIINFMSDYNKVLNYTGNASSCSLFMSNVKDFAVSAKIFTSSVSVPNGWPVYDMLSSNYNYTSENGTAKINIDVTSSSFIFE